MRDLLAIAKFLFHSCNQKIMHTEVSCTERIRGILLLSAHIHKYIKYFMQEMKGLSE